MKAGGGSSRDAGKGAYGAGVRSRVTRFIGSGLHGGPRDHGPDDVRDAPREGRGVGMLEEVPAQGDAGGAPLDDGLEGPEERLLGRHAGAARGGDGGGGA